MRNLFRHLVPVPRRRIQAYLDNPSLEGWKAIRDTWVLPGKSLYDIMDEIDRDWPGKFPPTILVARVSEVVEARLKERENLRLT